jgi:hypothetical protein
MRVSGCEHPGAPGANDAPKNLRGFCLLLDGKDQAMIFSPET